MATCWGGIKARIVLWAFRRKIALQVWNHKNKVPLLSHIAPLTTGAQPSLFPKHSSSSSILCLQGQQWRGNVNECREVRGGGPGERESDIGKFLHWDLLRRTWLRSTGAGCAPSWCSRERCNFLTKFCAERRPRASAFSCLQHPEVGFLATGHLLSLCGDRLPLGGALRLSASKEPRVWTPSSWDSRLALLQSTIRASARKRLFWGPYAFNKLALWASCAKASLTAHGQSWTFFWL